jgi:hypothetical protein
MRLMKKVVLFVVGQWTCEWETILQTNWCKWVLVLTTFQECLEHKINAKAFLIILKCCNAIA